MDMSLFNFDVKNQEPVQGPLNKEIEIEKEQEIIIEKPQEIKIETKTRTKAVKLRTKKFVCRKGSSKFPRSHYESWFLPNQEKNPQEWAKRRREIGLGASDMAKFTTYLSSQEDLMRSHVQEGYEPFFSASMQANMDIGSAIEKIVHKDLARQLDQEGIARLGEYTFTSVFLSKNRQYARRDLALGSQLDAWGMLGDKETIIEIKSTKTDNFRRIRQALAGEDFSLALAGNQGILAREIEYYYFQVQAQLLTTGASQALLHIIDKSDFSQTMSFLIFPDKKSFEWIKEVVKKFEELKKSFFLLSEEETEEALESFQAIFVKNPYENYQSEQEKRRELEWQRQLEELKNSDMRLEEELASYWELNLKVKEHKVKKEKLRAIAPREKQDVGAFSFCLDGRGCLQVKKLKEKEEKYEKVF